MTSLLAMVGLPMRGFRFGPLRLTPYGACAAVGLLIAMTLAGRIVGSTAGGGVCRSVRLPARGVGLEPEQAWDAGLFAIVSCFVASRLLLVLSDPVAFARYPLLVLSLPSLTLGGMALAAGMVWAYLRVKKLRVLSVLDTFAAPAAVLAVFLELGHWLDASEIGMPTSAPWGVRDPFDAGVRVHPVALYGMGAALLLSGVLWHFYSQSRARGSVAALGLVLGGAVAFGLDTLTQPSFLFAALWLEPGELVALATMLAGALLWAFLPDPGVDAEGAAADLQRAVAEDPAESELDPQEVCECPQRT